MTMDIYANEAMRLLEKKRVVEQGEHDDTVIAILTLYNYIINTYYPQSLKFRYA